MTELILGGLAYHPAMEARHSPKLKNKLGDSGKLIQNRLLLLKMEWLSVFAGTNSVGAPIAGMVGSMGAGERVRRGVVVGAYHQDGKPFRDRGLKTWHPIMPIGGIELSYYPNKSFGFVNIISPLLTVHALAIKF